MTDAEGKATWVFDELPPSGARRGGDPAEHAFKHDLTTFVREVVQNANDQAVGFPAVRFQPIVLSGARLARFLEAIDWPRLRLHLEGAARQRPRGALAEFLRQMQARDSLLLLQVEDRNTIGLTGDESEGDSHFRALCKDTLYSHKASEGAGGSYGLGKSVLWSFSALSTVVFCSVLLEDPKGRVSPRLIGRAELPSHAAAHARRPAWYSGSGWFGRTVGTPAGVRAESVWGAQARALAGRLSLDRAERSGTSLSIVGFREPASETDESVAALEQRIRAAVKRYFWPAMCMDTRRLRVSTQGGERERVVSAKDEPSLWPFLECYRQRDAPSARFEAPGDVALRRIGLDLPAPREGAHEHGEVDLVVRLADERTRDPLLGHVAMFRGPGMIVRYWDRSALGLGMRPFHALLVCGQARAPREPSAGDHAVERFLRAAEPPGHDDWVSTPALKQQYKRGYARALSLLRDRVNEELRGLLALRPAVGDKGPERLQRRFPIGQRGRAADDGASPFHFEQLEARFDGAYWHFSGTIAPEVKGRRWCAELRLAELGEDGTALETVPIAELVVVDSSAKVELDDARGIIEAEAEPRVSFRGRSAQGSSFVDAEVGLRVTGVIRDDA